MKKTKAVALMMMVIMFMVLMPQALWVSAAEKVRETDFRIKTYSTENNLSKEEEAYILYEDKEKRTENEKHFVLSDGTMMMEQYQEPVHYQTSDGEFKEIDNTFIEQVEDGVTYYKNKANKFEALFNRENAEGDLMKMRQGQYELSFNFLGREYGNIFQKKMLQASKVSPHLDHKDLNALKAEVDYKREKLTKAEAPEHLSASLKYQGLLPNIDVEYKVLPNGVKENIILSSKLDSYEFCFELKAENLVLELMPTGDIYAWPTDDTVSENLQPIYIIPAPFMRDNNGVISHDIHYELNGQVGGYLLKLIADEEWLNAAERSYPVVLDPIIETPTTIVNNVAYATVYEKGKATETSVSEYVVAGVDYDDSTKGLFSSYIRLNFANNIADHYQILSGKFTYNRGNANSWWGGMGYDVVVAQTVGDMTKLNWANKPRTLEKIEDSHIGFWGADIAITLDFDVRYIFNNSITFGFIFDDTNLARNWVKIYVHNSSKPLSISLKYKYRTGLNENAKYEKISLDGATAYVDTFSRRLTASFDILGTNSGVFPLQITGVYNTAYDTLMNGYNFTQAMGKSGKNVKLNFDQYLFSLDDGYIYIDQDGSVDKLIKNTANQYVSEKGLQLEIVSNTYRLKDKHGNLISFINGRPVSIQDIYGNQLTLTYSSESYNMTDNLIKISNNKGQYININYNSSNYISSVVNNYGESRTFEYDADHKLIAIKDVTEKIFELGYDINGHLNQIIDRDKQGIQIQYTANNVNTIHKTNGGKSNSVTSNDKILFSKYVASSIVERYDHGRVVSTTEYGYDQSGRCLSEVTYEGEHTQTSSAAQVNTYVNWNPDGSTIGNNSNHSFVYSYEEDLSSVPNGTFDTDSNWLRSAPAFSGGRAQLRNGNFISQSVSYTANQRGEYVLSFWAEANTRIATLKVTVNSSRMSKTFSYSVPNYNRGYLCFDIGELFEGTDTYYIRIENQAQPTGDVYIDNVSICMLTGFSNFQPGQYNSKVEDITYTHGVFRERLNQFIHTTANRIQ